MPVLNRKRKILLASALVLAPLIAAFDWNWFRRPLVSYVVEKSGREVRVDDLHVSLGFSLEPTIRLRGVYIENAPWAAKRPFATAAEASFTVSLRSIWHGHPVISRLALVDADIDMERQADGLRNWRLKHPDDRSGGKTRVLTLEAQRTKLRFVNRAIDLDFTAVSSAIAGDKEGLTTRILFEGTYAGAPFSGEAANAGILSFRDSGVTFPLRARMASRSVRLELDGLFTDVFDIGPFDAKVRVTGASLSQLHPFLRIEPPPSRPFAFESQVTQTHDVYEFADLTGRLGDTDLSGKATYDRSGDRPRVQAVLHSRSADVRDLRALAGIRPDSPSVEQHRNDRRLFPTRTIRTERLKAFDAHVSFDAKRLEVPGLPMFDSLRVAAVLDNGTLELKALDLGIAGGRVVGTLVLDARRDAPSGRANLELRDVRLERLLAATEGRARSTGGIQGRLELAGRGASVAAMLAHATGSLSVHLNGGSISNMTDAKLALNIGKKLGLALRGDRQIAIHCAAAAFDIRNGVATAKTMALDTEQTHTEGRGAVDLRNERLDLLFTPQPKRPGLFIKRASIRVHGSLRDADVALQDRVEIGVNGQGGTANGDSSSRDAGGNCTSK